MTELAAEPAQADDLLGLAVSRPRDALAGAREILASRPGPREASLAHQAAGIVLRDIGDVTAGIRELRAALKLARRTGSTEREADVLGSLGAALVHAGRTGHGLAAYDRAIELSSGDLLGGVLHRRGATLWYLGRYEEALADLGCAVQVLQGAHDPLWTARALDARGLVYLELGSLSRADADFAAAGDLYSQTDHGLESGHMVVNRANGAFLAGDLPTALSLIAEASARYRLLDVPAPSLSQVRCGVLLAGGLAADALAEADAAVLDIQQSRGRSTRKAGLLLTAATCALAADQPQVALDRAQAAYRLFRSQQSAWWQAHARLILLRAQYAAGPASGHLLSAAQRVAVRLDALGSGQAKQAHLLAGRAALDLGRRGDADRHLAIAAAGRRSGPAMPRVVGWLSEALRAQADADPRRLLAACRRGLEVLDQHRWTLGASELRAEATAHGAELALLAQRQAAALRRPRLLLDWSERWRATALAVPPVRPPVESGFTSDLAALRQVSSRLEEARRRGAPTAALKREQLRLEEAVRAGSLRTRGGPAACRATCDITALLDQLGSTTLIEIIDIDGALHVLVCGSGRVRQYVAGSTRDAMRAADFARFALRRLARARTGDDPGSATAILRAAGPDLQSAILGRAAAVLRDEPAVVVPPGKLHAIPWAVLPALGERVFSVAPSAAAWMRACAVPVPTRRRVALACGPGLASNGAEVPLIAELYDDVTVLSGVQATAGAVLSALDGAWLGHVAAHGTFRADSPLFSSLRMHDGPLTVYDFEQLNRAPYRLVLSSCDSGALAPAGADELLGLNSSLMPLGTAGIVAGVVPLNDQAVVPLMVRLHQCLRAGQSLGAAMCCVRCEFTADPVQRAAAMSLVSLGAA